MALFGGPDIFGNNFSGNTFSEQDAFNLNAPADNATPEETAFYTPSGRTSEADTRAQLGLPPLAGNEALVGDNPGGPNPLMFSNPSALIQQNLAQGLTQPAAPSSSTGNPQLDAIIAAINATPGASGNIGGQYYGGGGAAPVTGGQTPQQPGTGNTPFQVQNPFTNFAPFGGTNPWQSVTAGTVNEAGAPSGQTNFATAQNPNVNYITQDAATQIANMFGGNLLRQNYGQGAGPAGAPSAPMYGLDMGAGDPQNMGQIAFWLGRGDNPNDILARLQAGIAPPGGVSSRAAANTFYDNPIGQNFQQGQVSSFVPGTKDGAAFNPTGYFKGATPSTHLGPLGGGKATPTQVDPRFGGNMGGLGGFGTIPGGFPGSTSGSNTRTQYPGGGGLQSLGDPGGGITGFGPGSMSGFAGFRNGRRPYQNQQGYQNSWYYPSYEPNLMGGQSTYAGSQRRGFNVPKTLGAPKASYY